MNRILLFKGYPSVNGDPTSTQELSEFITSCMPPPYKSTWVKHFNYTRYLVVAKECGNADIAEAANEEKKLLQKVIENKDATIRYMMENNDESESEAEDRME